MAALIHFKDELSRFTRLNGLYRAEHAYDFYTYKVWKEDVGFRVEIWGQDYLDCWYQTVLTIPQLVACIPEEILWVDDWHLFGWFPA